MSPADSDRHEIADAHDLRALRDIRAQETDSVEVADLEAQEPRPDLEIDVYWQDDN